jgi:uncharacterized LabA/DUF88 family protein
VAFAFCEGSRVKTNVYVDGFNLYYGCVRHTPYRWLDLARLCRIMLPHNQIHRIRYFTARVQSSAHDPQKAQRQAVFLRALLTIPELSVHEGHFLTQRASMPLVAPQPGGSRMAEVWKTEEKGSDVNLATYLLLDGFDGDYESAVIVSNDSDLLLPVQVVRHRLGLPVGVLNPHPHPSRELLGEADYFKSIQPRALKKSLFPDLLYDTVGEIHKPAGW